MSSWSTIRLPTHAYPLLPICVFVISPYSKLRYNYTTSLSTRYEPSIVIHAIYWADGKVRYEYPGLLMIKSTSGITVTIN